MTVHTRGLLVHEWIEKTGGAENVLDQFAIAFPEAPIACLWNEAPARFAGREVYESPLASTPLRGRKAASAPLHPAIWMGTWHKCHEADWILTSSHSFAQQIAASRHGRAARTVTYVHTPARFLWAPEVDPRGSHPALRVLGPALRMIDRRRAAHIDVVVANSRYIRERIRRAWDRDAEVIYPPVEVEALLSVLDWRSNVTEARELAILETLPERFILGASRMVEYKRLELAIEGGAAVGLPVVIAGDGPDAARLKRIGEEASVPVTFVGRVSDEMLRALMQLASAYVFPPVEDFGIMPVEAMTLGTPVVVNGCGGARESVEILEAGTAFHSSDPSSLKRALLDAIDLRPDRSASSARARQHFGTERFRDAIRATVGSCVG